MTKLYRRFTAIALFVLVCGTMLMFAVTTQTNYVYANNDTASNTVSAFSITTGGVLTSIAGSPFSTGGNGIAGGYYASRKIAVIGSYLYASNSGNATISAFAINTTTGALTLVTGSPFAVPGNSGSGISLASAQGGKYLVAADAGAVTSFTIGSNGALTQANSVTIEDNPDGLSCQLNGSYCAYADPGDYVVQVFSVASNGTLTLGTSVNPNTWITDVAFNTAGTYLYGVTNNTLYVWTVDSSGNLAAVSGYNPFTSSDTSLGQSIALTTDQKYFVTSDPNNNLVSSYALATGGGGASEVSGSPWSANQPAGAAVTTDGLYSVFGSFGGPVTLWSNSSGVLTEASDLTDSGNLGYSSAVAVYPAPSGTVTTLTTLTVSPSSVLVSNPVTLTATVSGSKTPTGTVTFYDGSTSIGTGTLSSGKATLTLSNFTVGTHSLTAAYPGVTGFSASTSTAQSLLVQDFNFTIDGGGTVISTTVLPGNTATYTFTVAPTSGTTFPSAVSFNLSGVPNGASYTITPSSLAVGSGSQTVTVAIVTPSATSSVRHAKNEQKRMPWMPALAMMLPLAGVVLLRRKVKRWAPVLLLLAIALTMGAVSCGGSGNGFYAQAPVTYTMPFTGTSGTLSHSITLDLTIQ